MNKFAVFDIDGTLIRWQLYHAIVNELAKKGFIGKNTYAQIQDARMDWKVRSHPEAFKDYENEVIRLFELAIKDIKLIDFDQTVDKIIHKYKEQVYTYTRDLVSKLKHKRYVLLAISGSHQELIKLLAEHYKFDDFAGTIYKQKDGKFTGDKLVASHNKAKVLDNLVKKHNLTYKDSYAVGDSLSDASMLEKVENPIAFNPDQNLYKEAKKHGWRIVLERKNVIYELESTDDKYLLA